MLKQRPLDYLSVCLAFVLFVLIGYVLERHQTALLFICYFILFFHYLFLIRRLDSVTEAGLSFWISTSILFRGALLFSIPNLSDDFYRFIWDGRVLAAGHSPFSQVPSFYMDSTNSTPGLVSELYVNLNSKERFSSYPPICQLIYWISAKLSPRSIFGSVVVMKTILFLFELGTLWILGKMLRRLNMPSSRVLIYALNPLVIIEITGNLHFEGVMIFFLVVAIHFIMRQSLFFSAASFALSVCTKLIPLLFLPLFFHPLGWKKAFGFWSLTGIFTLLLFVPLLNRDIVHGFLTGLGYYFQHFEFNASIYYLIREAGYLVFGFNIIQIAGPLLALLATILILNISFRRYKLSLYGNINSDLFKGMLWCLFIYLLSTTVLHPWYIITLLAISIFTQYRFPVVWTGLIFLTYAGYTETAFEENLFLVALEYVVVIVYLLYETVWANQKSHY